LATLELVQSPIYYGANKSSRSQANIARIDEFAAENQVLAVDGQTARHYGEVKHALHIKGKPIPENDIWIAALSRQHQYTLVTQDNHFNEVDGIETIHW
jgi:tRNA(fMet)-specific endonuclease VapC